MQRVAFVVALAAIVAVAPSVYAQDASPTDTQLQMDRQQRRVIVRPAPPPEVVERDVQDVTAEVEQRRQQQEIARDLRRPLPRRPDLDYDVKSGIQSQRLNDVLRRR